MDCLFFRVLKFIWQFVSHKDHSPPTLTLSAPAAKSGKCSNGWFLYISCTTVWLATRLRCHKLSALPFSNTEFFPFADDLTPAPIQSYFANAPMREVSVWVFFLDGLCCLCYHNNKATGINYPQFQGWINQREEQVITPVPHLFLSRHLQPNSLFII